MPPGVMRALPPLAPVHYHSYAMSDEHTQQRTEQGTTRRVRRRKGEEHSGQREREGSGAARKRTRPSERYGLVRPKCYGVMVLWCYSRTSWWTY